MRLTSAVGELVIAIGLFAPALACAKGEPPRAGAIDAKIAQSARTEQNVPDQPVKSPSASQDATSPVYPMNYTDELAKSLGVKNGDLDFFSTNSSGNIGSTPTFSAGITHQGAAFRIRW